ncbi:GpE family phage tail protein [Erythrobacter sp. SG61-1L]|nr:GpE family phage tail protein [Erythrobacter sp. SG61-1L]
MADVAFLFHWPLADLREMDLEELAMWQRLAVDRYEMNLKAVLSPWIRS